MNIELASLDLGNLRVGIVLDAKDANEGLDNFKGKVDDLDNEGGKKMSSFKSVASSAMGAVGTAASKAGELMATMAKATTAAVGAAAAGLAALTKSAVGHYADYE